MLGIIAGIRVAQHLRATDNRRVRAPEAMVASAGRGGSCGRLTAFPRAGDHVVIESLLALYDGGGIVARGFGRAANVSFGGRRRIRYRLRSAFFFFLSSPEGTAEQLLVPARC